MELRRREAVEVADVVVVQMCQDHVPHGVAVDADELQGLDRVAQMRPAASARSEEHTSELQSRLHLVCRLLLEKKKKNYKPLRFTNTDLKSNSYTQIQVYC